MAVQNKTIEEYEIALLDSVERVLNCSKDVADKKANASDKAKQLELTIGRYENYIDAVHHTLEAKIKEKRQKKMNSLYNQYEELLYDLESAEKFDRGINMTPYTEAEINKYTNINPFYGIDGGVAKWHNINVVVSFLLLIYILVRGIIAVASHNNVFTEITNDKIFIYSLITLVLSCLIEIITAQHKTEGYFEAENRAAREESRIVKEMRAQRVDNVEKRITAFREKNLKFFKDGKFKRDYTLIPVTREMAEQALQEAVNSESRPSGCTYQFQISID